MPKKAEFSDWLLAQLDLNGLTQAQLALTTGLNPATLTKILNGKTKRPEPESCIQIAKALKVAEQTVYRAVGVLSDEPDYPEQDDLNYIVAQLSDQQRREILVIARALLALNDKENTHTK